MALQDLRQRLETLAEQLVGELEGEGLGPERRPDQPEELVYAIDSPQDAARVASTASALCDVVRAAAAVPASGPAPFDLMGLGNEIWTAVAEAGGTTAASDAAVEVLRKAAARA